MGSAFGRFTIDPMIRRYVWRAHALRSAALVEAWRLLPLPQRSWFAYAFKGLRL